MFGLLSQKNVFFDLFEKLVRNVHEGAKALKDLLENFEDVPQKVQGIKNIEHEGDEFTHRILDHLAKTFITPLDREDIHNLARRLDDILDEMDVAANRMMLFNIKKPTAAAMEFGKILNKTTGLLIDAFAHLRDMKKSEKILTCCVEIHTQENEGDRLMQYTMAKLFDEEEDTKEIIKWKEIYQVLEQATDRCEDVADVLQTIIVKHT